MEQAFFCGYKDLSLPPNKNYIMTKSFILIVGLCLSVTFPAFTQNTDMDSLSYSVGMLIAQNLKQQGLQEVKAADVAQAIEDVMAGSTKMTVEEAGQIFQSHMEKEQKKQFASIIKEGEDFLAENGKRKEVVTLASGMQYEIMTEGKGDKPGPTDKVTTHYHGTLLDGKVFDSSVQRNEPASFPVNGVIQGWQEALQLMPVGSKWKLFIPYHLAYGERGAGGDIKPYATLIFEVELLSID